MTVTVAGIKTTKKCVQMSGVIMSSPCGLAKVKIWSLFGQTSSQEFIVVMQASESFSLAVVASVGTLIRARRCMRAELTHKKMDFERCLVACLSLWHFACLLGFKTSSKCSQSDQPGGGKGLLHNPAMHLFTEKEITLVVQP